MNRSIVLHSCLSWKNLSRITCLLVLLAHNLSSLATTVPKSFLSSASVNVIVSYISFTRGPTTLRNMAALTADVASAFPTAVKNWLNSLLNRNHCSGSSPSQIGSGARYFSILLRCRCTHFWFFVESTPLTPCLQTGFQCLVSITPIDTGTTTQRTTTNKRGLSTKAKSQSTQTINSGQVLVQLMPPGSPSNSRGDGPAGRCFCASLLPCSFPHCCLEEVGGEQGAEVSTAIGHEYGHRRWNRVTATITAFNAIVGVDYCIVHHHMDCVLNTVCT